MATAGVQTQMFELPQPELVAWVKSAGNAADTYEAYNAAAFAIR